MCDQCRTLQAEVLRQQNEIMRLQRIIQQAQMISSKIADKANGLMTRGGIPKGKWAYARGACEAATTILSYLAG